MEVRFSVLSYYPSFIEKDIENESMYIGILFHNIDTDERRLEITTKWTRIQNFDDELDIEFFKILLYSLQEEVKNSFWSIRKDFDIYQYTSKFINELRFSKVMKVNTDDFNRFIDDTKKMFLRFDYEKKSRPDKDEQLKYIKKLFKDSNVKFSKSKRKGAYNELIKYDYIVGNTAFKIFTFLNKDMSKVIPSAKIWAFNAWEMKNKYNIDTIFVYDIDIKDDRFKIIYNILEENSLKVIPVEEIIDYLNKGQISAFDTI